MKIKLLCMGAVRDKAAGEIISRYASRISHYWPFELIELPDVKLGKGVADAGRQKEAEAEKFATEIGNGDFVILFDEHGKEMTSRQLSDFIVRKAVELPRNMIFIIGGPYGFGPKMHVRADMKLSMSQMTLPHELARLFAVEQLYRAGTISRGEPYHHD